MVTMARGISLKTLDTNEYHILLCVDVIISYTSKMITISLASYPGRKGLVQPGTWSNYNYAPGIEYKGMEIHLSKLPHT